ncbi:hypothetical protein GA707_03280 [Nostocoides sp. F2B08]|uniref:hypothetical protein n=1 Tax=Nostocoides sp. F2B08 TaxID=2653936 RepID=UPI001262E517|nr:hypothetical protein [Tetrasphaera sp. F2B08]KAB7746524.1 hypothetical protein GA707_03280 [Tetrasphaera sp. F2B08]
MTREDGRDQESSSQAGGRRLETGMATAELAVGLVSLLLVLAVVLAGLRAGMDRAGATSVAGLVAREAAHSGAAGAERLWADVQPRLPAGSSMSVGDASGLVVVRVSVPVRAGLAGHVLPDRVTVEAVARDERS